MGIDYYEISRLGNGWWLQQWKQLFLSATVGLEVLGPKWAEKQRKHREGTLTEARGTEQHSEEKANPVHSAFIFKMGEIVVGLYAGKNGSLNGKWPPWQEGGVIGRVLCVAKGCGKMKSKMEILTSGRSTIWLFTKQDEKLKKKGRTGWAMRWKRWTMVRQTELCGEDSEQWWDRLSWCCENSEQWWDRLSSAVKMVSNGETDWAVGWKRWAMVRLSLL